MFSMVDMYMCFAMVMLAVYTKPQNAIEEEYKAKQEQIAMAEKQLETFKTKAKAERKSIEEDHALRMSQIDGETEVAREQLAKRQKDYADWNIIVQEFVRYAKLPKEPDYHFYLRQSGIYSSTSAKKWTKSGFETWLSELAKKTPQGSQSDMVFYVENGANDAYIYSRNAIATVNKKQGEAILGRYVILPPGTRAGPSTLIHKEQGGGE